MTDDASHSPAEPAAPSAGNGAMKHGWIVLSSIAAAMVLVVGGFVDAGIVGSVPSEYSAPPAPVPSDTVDPLYVDEFVDDTVGLGELGENRREIAYAASDVQCGLTVVTDGGVEQSASGQYCEARVTIANRSSTAFQFWETYAGAGVGGRSYPVDAIATLWAGGADVLAEPIAPGASIDTELVFDVPYGESPDYFLFGQRVVDGYVVVDASVNGTDGS